MIVVLGLCHLALPTTEAILVDETNRHEMVMGHESRHNRNLTRHATERSRSSRLVTADEIGIEKEASNVDACSSGALVCTEPKDPPQVINIIKFGKPTWISRRLKKRRRHSLAKTPEDNLGDPNSLDGYYNAKAFIKNKFRGGRRNNFCPRLRWHQDLVYRRKSMN